MSNLTVYVVKCSHCDGVRATFKFASAARRSADELNGYGVGHNCDVYRFPTPYLKHIETPTGNTIGRR